MRIDLPQEVRLRAAAEANGETLTSFVLAAAVDRAERVLRRSGRISLCRAAGGGSATTHWR